MGRNDEFKLFIGGLHPATRTESLKLHFSEYGHLTDCIVMLDQSGASRGFGFVTYESAEGFNTILDAGGRVIVDGKEVEAKPATGKDNQRDNQRNSAPQRGGGGGKGGNVKARDVTGKIFVGGTSHLSTDALSAHFSQYGEVTDAIAMTDPRGTPRGFGFVTFADQQDANAAVENINNIEGISVDCKHADGTSRDGPLPQQHQQGARPSGRNQQANNQSAGRGGGHDQGKGGRSGGKGGGSGGNDEAYKIFVGGLPNSVSTGRLQDLFQMYGPVEDCVAFQDRGFGYVTFSNSGAMNRALQAGSVQIDGKWVEIKARDSTKGGGKSGGGFQRHHSPPPPQRQQRNSHAGGKGGSGGKGPSGGGGRPHEAGKMFVGGLHHSTTDSSFRRYFEQFGDLSDSIVMKKPDGGSRGFGFVTYVEPSVARRVINQVNVIDGQNVDAKMAEREGGKGQDSGPQGRGGGYQKSSGGGGMPVESNKIFLGGLPQEMSTEKLSEYMSEYGEITDCIAMEGRGFGYVTFRDENSVDSVLSNSHIEIEGKSVEVKPCTIPRHKGQGRARPY